MKTIEELEAALEIVTRERDLSLAAWESAGMTGRTAQSAMLELARQLDEARAEVKTWQSAYDRANDHAWEQHSKIDRLTRERDEAKDKLEHYLRPASATESVRSAAKRRMVLDGADAQALENAITLTERERDEARAEVERLTDERDELLKAYAKAYDEWDHSKYSRAEVAVAYRRGAEAMREACADCVKHLSHEDGLGMGSQRLEGAIRALPIPEEP
jgi:chromosome segregation ATPase